MLREVVLERHISVIQEREEGFRILAKTLREPPRVAVYVRFGGQIGEPLVQPVVERLHMKIETNAQI